VTPFFERLRSAMTRVKIAPFTTHTSAFSRHWLPELCRKSCPQRHKGAGNAGRFGAPAALCAKGKSTQVSHHRFADYAGTPCAIGFNGLLRALVSGLFVTIIGAMRQHCRQLDVSVETSGPHGLAVRIPKGSPRHAGSGYRIPRQRSQRPSNWARDARRGTTDLPDDARGIFRDRVCERNSCKCDPLRVLLQPRADHTSPLSLRSMLAPREEELANLRIARAYLPISDAYLGTIEPAALSP
jgi:hypothetical protein